MKHEAVAPMRGSKGRETPGAAGYNCGSTEVVEGEQMPAGPGEESPRDVVCPEGWGGTSPAPREE